MINDALVTWYAVLVPLGERVSDLEKTYGRALNGILYVVDYEHDGIAFACMLKVGSALKQVAEQAAAEHLGAIVVTVQGEHMFNLADIDRSIDND